MLKTIKEHLQRQANVFIIGRPGSGKTTLAWTVCKQMHGESFKGQKWYVKASTSVTRLPDDKAMTLILLLDGQFENAWTTDKMVEKVLDELKYLRDNLPSKKVLTIATLSKEAYGRISKYSCIEKLQTMEIINLDGKRNTLTTAEMTNVLETHNIFVKNVREANESNVLSQKQLQGMYDCLNNHEKKAIKSPKIGFPLIASLMSLNSPFIGNINFVKEPLKLICESIKRLRESSDPIDKNKYCTIVYASWKWGYVDTDNVDQDLLTKIGEHHGHPGAEIDPEFYVLRKRTATIYEFLHESLLRAIFAAYGTHYMGFVIEHCPLLVLLEYSVSQREKYISDAEKVFFLTIGGIVYEEDLVRRIRDGNVDIRHHRIWEQNGFQELYKKIYAEGDVSNKYINMESL
ncbi:hypothetical protein FSP39_015961 [Pinctada imbricata]|uniref:Novel STAND NTPase 3 domain-containing protein n=1 Tax=Pinctada imbricata TaxID=66713 RepID=A0AA88YN85_PINIB|nr:hypothetical protein FSP39_015961 [Pinctada imbricata]